jgi:hypothetical protein
MDEFSNINFRNSSNNMSTTKEFQQEVFRLNEMLQALLIAKARLARLEQLEKQKQERDAFRDKTTKQKSKL